MASLRGESRLAKDVATTKFARIVLNGWLAANYIEAHEGPRFAQSLERMKRAIGEALREARHAR